MRMTTLRDYAKENHISYEAVRKQTVRYAAELEGHIFKDGRQQLLDEDAVAFLDAKRQKNPIAIIQIEKDEKIEQLEAQVKQLLIKTAEQAVKISEMAEWKADNAMLIAAADQTKLALAAAEASREEYREQADRASQEAAAAAQALKEIQDKLKEVEEEKEALAAENKALWDHPLLKLLIKRIVNRRKSDII